MKNNDKEMVLSDAHAVETDDRNVLEALVVDNSDLEQLEALLEQFNIFEALGAVRVELRHSDFLAFLLNPKQNHGLGDTFLKILLQKALSNADRDSIPVTPIDLDLWDLNEIMVHREWQNIDILLVDDRNRIVVVIENKVVSGEHGDQLERYQETIKTHYSSWRTLYFFLTPEGQEPSDPNYIPIDYNLVAKIIERLVESRASTLGPDVRTLMIHYCQMLRRHIVSESEIAELCRKIYRKHQQALDLIYEYRPDKQEEIREYLLSLVSEASDMKLDISTKTYIRFVPENWDTPLLLQGERWTRTGRMLLFEFTNHPNRLNLNLVIGPGPQDTRQRLFDIAHEHQPPFKPAFKALGKSFNTIFQRRILTSKVLENADKEELEDEIRKKFTQFLKQEFKTINKILGDQAWIWETKD